MPLSLRLLRRVGARRTLVMVDQAVSGLSNIVVTVMVARLLGPAQFGAFSVAMVTYQLAVGAVRAVVGEPWLSSHSTDEPSERGRAMTDLVPAALLLAVACSLVIAVVALAAGGAATAAMLALAIVFPYLGVQDALRFAAVVDRPQVALASDAAWLVAVVGLVAVAPDRAASEWFVVAWGVAGAAGLLVALGMLRLPLQTGRAGRWLAAHRTMSMAYFGEFVSARAAGHVVLLGLGAMAGLAALGAVRAAQVFYGPLNTLFGGLYLALVPDGARRRDRPHELVRLMVQATGLVTVAAIGWLVAGLVMPDRLGTELFGRTWLEAEDLILLTGLATIAGSLSTGGFAGLRSLGAARVSLRARLYSLPPMLVLTLGGAAAGAAVGYTVGFAAANVVVAAIWWTLFLGALGRPTGRPAPTAAPAWAGGRVPGGGPGERARREVEPT